MSGIQSPLGRLIPESMDVEDIKRRGFHEDGILVVDMRNDPMTWDEKEQFRQWGERRYPRRESVR